MESIHFLKEILKSYEELYYDNIDFDVFYKKIIEGEIKIHKELPIRIPMSKEKFIEHVESTLQPIYIKMNGFLDITGNKKYYYDHQNEMVCEIVIDKDICDLKPIGYLSLVENRVILNRNLKYCDLSHILD